MYIWPADTILLCLQTKITNLYIIILMCMSSAFGIKYCSTWNIFVLLAIPISNYLYKYNVTNMSEKQVLTSFGLRFSLSLLFPTVQEPSCLLCSSVLSSTVCDLLTTLPFIIIKTAVFLWGHFWYEISYCNLPLLALFRILPHCQHTVTLMFWESNLI